MEPQTQQQEFIYRSNLPDIYIPNHVSLHEYCFENITQFFSRPCLINGATGKVHTYADVELMSRKVAAGLNKLGIQQGEVIMLLLNNSPEFVFAFLGSSYRGATAMTVNPIYSPAHISELMKSSKARFIITESSFVDMLKDLAQENDVKIMCIDSPPEGCMHFSELIQSNENDMPSVEINPDDIVVLPFSSGTTGLPKCVLLTHKNLVTNIAQVVDGENPNLYFNSEDVLLCVVPMYHLYALPTILLCGLRTGTAILIMKKFEVEAVMEHIQKYKVTVAQLFPAMVVTIAKSTAAKKYDLSSIRKVMAGDAPLGKEFENTLRTMLPNAKFGQAYGLSESGPVVSMCLVFAKEQVDMKPGSSGTIVRNAELKIIDLQTGVSLPPNKSGEICIRGAQVMKGYFNDPEATERAIDKDGWLHTEDVGYIDEDNESFIIGRMIEMIKYKEFHVAPAELETLLLMHPKIIDAAVVPMKDDVAGEVPVAFVMKSNGCELTEGEVMQYISEQVDHYKRINRVFFVDNIPRLPTSKVPRNELIAKLATDVHKLT